MTTLKDLSRKVDDAYRIFSFLPRSLDPGCVSTLAIKYFSLPERQLLDRERHSKLYQMIDYVSSGQPKKVKKN